MKSKHFFILFCISIFAFASCGEDEPDDVTVIDAQLSGSAWTDNQIEVDLTAVMEITFSRAVDPQKVVSKTSLGTTGPAINSSASFSADSTMMTITPDGLLTNQSEYSLLITAGELAVDGGMLLNDYERSFSTK
jgi:hypothetical protein